MCLKKEIISDQEVLDDTNLSKKGTIIIEIQYLMNTLKDVTFDNIYHEHYNYWSLTSLINFASSWIANLVLYSAIALKGTQI